MAKQSCILSLFIALIFSAPAPLLADQKTIQSDDIFQFARQYLDKKDYQKAIIEFDRFIYFFPDEEKVPEARYLTGLCYLESAQFEESREILRKVYEVYRESPYAGEALFLLGESYYRQGLWDESELYFRAIIQQYPHGELKSRAYYRIAWIQLKRNQWAEASSTFRMAEDDSQIQENARLLSQLSLEGEKLPYKNPTSAGVMAGILPGLGHAYCGRYKDGLIAFVLNGLFIWAAVEAFKQDNNVLGGILVAVELGWYVGNIYSAVNVAHKYNRKKRDDFRQGLPDSLQLNLFSARKGNLGLALTIPF
jgi:tetratricopeptide (TPR) repeat protein